MEIFAELRPADDGLDKISPTRAGPQRIATLCSIFFYIVKSSFSQEMAESYGNQLLGGSQRKGCESGQGWAQDFGQGEGGGVGMMGIKM